jgi:hypothetical protein
LTAQTGHGPEQWPLVILKEIVDNAIDESEKCGVPLIIDIEVADGNIIISDNGQGIAAETVKKILDFTVRASDKEAYVSPTRGAQGNALKTIVAMAFALDGTSGETVIEAYGIKHTITFEGVESGREGQGRPRRSPDAKAEAGCLGGGGPRRGTGPPRIAAPDDLRGRDETPDLFERDNIDPSDRAAAIIEHFDQSLAETTGTGKFSVARVSRAIDAMALVFTAITAEL